MKARCGERMFVVPTDDRSSGQGADCLADIGSRVVGISSQSSLFDPGTHADKRLVRDRHS